MSDDINTKLEDFTKHFDKKFDDISGRLNLLLEYFKIDYSSKENKDGTNPTRTTLVHNTDIPEDFSTNEKCEEKISYTEENQLKVDSHDSLELIGESSNLTTHIDSVIPYSDILVLSTIGNSQITDHLDTRMVFHIFPNNAKRVESVYRNSFAMFNMFTYICERRFLEDITIENYFGRIRGRIFSNTKRIMLAEVENKFSASLDIGTYMKNTFVRCPTTRSIRWTVAHLASKNTQYVTGTAFLLSVYSDIVAQHNQKVTCGNLIFRSSYESLVSLVSFRVQYPHNSENISRDDRREVKQTRYVVGDVLIDAASVLGGEVTQKILYVKIVEAARSCRTDEEASRYYIRPISSYVSVVEAEVIPRVMMLLPKLPLHPQLLQTVCLTIRAYSRWLDASPNGLLVFPSMIELLMSDMNVSEDSAAAAALAFKNIGDNWRQKRYGSLDGLFHIYHKEVSGEGGYKVSAKESLYLVEALSMELINQEQHGDEEVIVDLLADGKLMFQVSCVVGEMFLTKCKELRNSKAYMCEKTESEKRSSRYMPYSNVDSFLKICKVFGLTGINLFSPSDVVEKKDSRRVCMCICSLSKKARLRGLNVPDFDVVTYTIATPTDMVGGIRRSLEKAQYIILSSANSDPELDSKPKYCQNNWVADCGKQLDSYLEEYDDAESNNNAFGFDSHISNVPMARIMSLVSKFIVVSFVIDAEIRDADYLFKLPFVVISSMLLGFVVDSYVVRSSKFYHGASSWTLATPFTQLAVVLDGAQLDSDLDPSNHVNLDKLVVAKQNMKEKARNTWLDDVEDNTRSIYAIEVLIGDEAFTISYETVFKEHVVDFYYSEFNGNETVVDPIKFEVEHDTITNEEAVSMDRVPDPSTPNLKIDLLAETSESQLNFADVDTTLKAKQMKSNDEYIKTALGTQRRSNVEVASQVNTYMGILNDIIYAKFFSALTAVSIVGILFDKTLEARHYVADRRLG